MVCIIRLGGYLFFMTVVMAFALHAFNTKVSEVLPGTSAAESHSINQACVEQFPPGIFDLHDLWHMGSAIGLALVAMFLLDVKLHSFLQTERGIDLMKLDDPSDEEEYEEWEDEEE